MKKVIYEKKFEEAYRFDEKSKIQRDIIDTLLSFRQLQKFSPKTIEQAYLIYANINKLSGKSEPIPIHRFISDMTWEDALDTATWTNIFLNSALFDLMSLYREYPEISDFAKKALDDNEMRGKFMRFVNDKKPKNIETIAKYVAGVV